MASDRSRGGYAGGAAAPGAFAAGYHVPRQAEEAKSVKAEPDVLPIFYYNDLLVEHVGDHLGLNLFEPRYREMCKRMSYDPRFVFMPNYHDYECRPGDLGFIMRLTQMRPNRDGESYGVHAEVVGNGVVRCNWVEPRTNGLHMAQFWMLSGPSRAVDRGNAEGILGKLEAHGWREKALPLYRKTLAFRDSGDSVKGTGEAVLHLVVAGLNLQSSEVRFLLLADDPQDAEKLVLAHAPELAGSLFHVPRPSPWKIRPLLGLLQTFDRTVAGECPGLYFGHKAISASSKEGTAAMRSLRRDFLRQLHVCSVASMSADLRHVSLEFDGATPHNVRETYPNLRFQGTSLANALYSPVIIRNGVNVLIYLYCDYVGISMVSAEAAESLLLWRLNEWRLQLIWRARRGGWGPFAAMEEDALRLISGFVALPPPVETAVRGR